MMSQLLLSAALVFPVFIVAWGRQQYSKNAGWVDVIWAFGVALTGLYYAATGTGEWPLRLTIALIYGCWFTRLGMHLWRRVQGEPEDGRYAYLRDWAGDRAGWVFLLFYLMQASWVLIFSLPALLLSEQAMPPWPAWLAAILVVVLAWIGEAVADQQLAEFKKNPDNRGRTCRKGLWGYSRHPNYFFEWCHWFAYPLLGWGTASGLWLCLAPVVMFIFLYFVTGIPFTERQALRSRGEDYREYQRNTSMFIPWRST